MRAILYASVLSTVLASPALAVVINNGIAAGTLGSLRVDVTTGGETRDGNLTYRRADNNQIEDSDIIFDYYSYVNTGTTGFRLSGTAPVVITADREVRSTGSFGGSAGNTINWSVNSRIDLNGNVLFNTFVFTAATGTLGTLNFQQYLDEDVIGAGNDAFFTRGAAATANLELFTVDGAALVGVSHGGAYNSAQGLLNATFVGYGVCEYNDMKPQLAAGTQALSLTGSVCSAANRPITLGGGLGPGLGLFDIVSVLGWSVNPSATSATIITTLGGVPTVTSVPPTTPPPPPPPTTVSEPGALALFALGLGGLVATRRRRG
jgi:MYXO-CTERM domain-containing protein